MPKFRVTLTLTDDEHKDLLAMRASANGDGFWDQYTWREYGESVARVEFSRRLREFRERQLAPNKPAPPTCSECHDTGFVNAADDVTGGTIESTCPACRGDHNR